MVDLKIFGKRVKELRNVKGLSIEGLAFSSGVSTSAIKALESGKSNFSFSTISKLSQALDFDLFILLATSDFDLDGRLNNIINVIEYKISSGNFNIIDDLEELELMKDDILSSKKRRDIERLTYIYSGIIDLDIYKDSFTAKEKFIESLKLQSSTFVYKDITEYDHDPIKIKAISNISFLYKVDDLEKYLLLSKYVKDKSYVNSLSYYKYLLNLSSAHIIANDYENSLVLIEEYFSQKIYRKLEYDILFLYNKIICLSRLKMEGGKEAFNLVLSLCDLLGDPGLGKRISHNVKIFNLC